MSLKVLKISSEKGEPMPGEGHIGVESIMAIPERKVESYSCRVMRFDRDGSTAMHSHEREHVVAVLKGKVRIDTESETVELTQDKVVIVPPNHSHRFINIDNNESVIMVQNLYE
jgi:quercetin dioxygenase-like cupin family protein